MFYSRQQNRRIAQTLSTQQRGENLPNYRTRRYLADSHDDIAQGILEDLTEPGRTWGTSATLPG